MMNKVSNSIKRWWMLALVFALAMSLTSCSRKGANFSGDYGQANCTGAFGDMIVYTVPENNSNGSYDVYLYVNQAQNAGETIIAYVNDSSGQYYRQLSQISLQNDTESMLGTISSSELNQFTMLTLDPPGTQAFNDPAFSPEAEQGCELPAPAQSSTQTALGN